MGGDDKLGRRAGGVALRPYRSEDIGGVLSAWEKASRKAHHFLSEEFFAAEVKAIPEIYLPKARTHVATAGGAVIGFVSMLGNEVGAIFVDPAHWGAGVGRRLLDCACADFGVVTVEVFERNETGRPFYERIGFVETGRHRHEATGETLIRMQWERAASHAR